MRVQMKKPKDGNVFGTKLREFTVKVPLNPLQFDVSIDSLFYCELNTLSNI